MKRQLKYFLLGTLFVFLAALIVTLFPVILNEFGFKIKPLIFSQIELFLLILSGVFYIFCPKYYRWQILVILYGICYYFIFLRVWF